MKFFMKVAVIFLILYLCIKYTKIGREQFSYASNLTKTVIVQQEVDAIGRVIYSEFATNEEDIPDKSREYWTDYIRTHLDSRIEGKDMGVDQWHIEYVVRRLDRIPGNGGRRGFTVISAGPDTKFGTGDDISATISY